MHHARNYSRTLFNYCTCLILCSVFPYFQSKHNCVIHKHVTNQTNVLSKSPTLGSTVRWWYDCCCWSKYTTSKYVRKRINVLHFETQNISKFMLIVWAQSSFLFIWTTEKCQSISYMREDKNGASFLSQTSLVLLSKTGGSRRTRESQVISTYTCHWIPRAPLLIDKTQDFFLWWLKELTSRPHIRLSLNLHLNVLAFEELFIFQEY